MWEDGPEVDGVRRLVQIVFFVALAASPVWAATLTLTLVSPTIGQWQVFGQLSNNTDNDGLASLIINVQAAGDALGISSSLNELPEGVHYWLDGNVQSQLVGFTEFRSDGNSGIGICAGQKTTSLGQVVLTDVGYSAGSTPGDETGLGLGPTLISWSSPVLMASGTYSGLYGTLSVAVGAGQVNVLNEGRHPSQTGGVHKIESVVGGQLRVYCPGDASRDDSVNGTDLAIMGGAWLQPGGTHTWADGDFNGDGQVNATDLALMGSHWLWSAPSPAPPDDAAPLPEPATLALLSLGAATLFARGRRSR
jgi:hypothetical protein